jgi:signal transduction histidine kinase
VHDLRQALAAGILLADPQLDGNGSGDGELGHRLRTLRTLLESAIEILDPFASQADTDEGVDIAAVVHDIVDAVNLGGRAAVTLVALDDARGQGDGVLLRRAIGNVLDNALRAAGDGGEVSVVLERRDSDVLIEVSDDGPGFGEIPGGAGHGLAVVHEAMRAWHGRLEIASGPGPGTTVRLAVPSDREAVAS